MGLLVASCSVAALREGAGPRGMLGDAPGLAGPETGAPNLGKRQQNDKTQKDRKECDSGLLRGDHNGV